MADDPTPILGSKVVFSLDPLARAPQATALADGTFILAWEDGTDIFARHLDKHGGFTSGNFLITLTSDNGNILSTPRVFQQVDGRVVVVYMQLVTPNETSVHWHLVNTDFTPAGNTKPILASATNRILRGVTARTGAPGQSGGAIAFEFPDGMGNTRTGLRLFNRAGNSLPPFQIEQGGDNFIHPAVAGFNSFGQVVVAYCRLENAPNTGSIDTRSIGAAIYDFRRRRVGPFRLASADNVFADSPEVAVLKDGSYVVTWQESEGIAFGRKFVPTDFSASSAIVPGSSGGLTPKITTPSDGGLHEPVTIVPGSSGGFLPKIAALDDGGFLLAWTTGSGAESDGSPNEDIFLQRYGFENNVLQTVGAQVHLAEPGDQGLFDLSIATLRGTGISFFDERAVVAYRSETGDATNISTLNYRLVTIPPDLVFEPAINDGSHELIESIS